MIENLSGSVSFPINGVSLNVNISLQPGITAIIGENGSGKTFTGSELPRWLLFGKKALRGAAGDYANLKGKGSFVISGERYWIERGPQTVQITDDKGKVLAVKDEAVTAEVERLLGYGLAVFDICNASPQKKADMFGSMPPAKRKRMIDRVIGLTSNEKVEKACRDEATMRRREAEALTRQLREPVIPTKPDRYRKSEEIEAELNAGRALRSKADEIGKRIQTFMMPAPPNHGRPDQARIDVLEKQHTSFLEMMAERRQLEGILDRCIPYDKDGWTNDQLLLAEARLLAKEEIKKRGPRPRFELGTVEGYLAEWAQIKAFQQIEKHEVTCPKCGHEFHTGPEIPKEPPFTEGELLVDLGAHRAWSGPEIVVPDGPDLTRPQIEHALTALEAKKLFDETTAKLAALPKVEDCSKELLQLKAWGVAWQAYDMAYDLASHQRTVNLQAEKELKQLGEVPSQASLDGLWGDLHNAKMFEQATLTYLGEMQRSAELQGEIAEKNKMAEEFTRGATSLSEARAMVKSFIGPKLSIIASALINEMTLGKLSSIVVDDDMEITVNGQKLETLSGAGETVANIALRIALGQALVANTFPVFLGDEMDSDADDQRRTATAEAIRNLKTRLKQIILITHRDVEIADHVIHLNEGESCES